MYDYLIVGAGFAGSVCAERLASAGKRVLLCDRRSHIGGNAFDHYDDSGLLVHKYGPHIFHTASGRIFRYLSRFTEWRSYEHRVLVHVDGKLLPFPINIDTINHLYGLHLDETNIAAFYESRAEQVAHPRTSEDVVVSRVGRELYEKFFRNYTRKQWGLDPSELDAAVAARVPARTNRDHRYFTDEFQAMPRRGYTRLFEQMLDSPNVTIALNADYRDLVGEVAFREMIYTGPVDAFFDHCYGKLPYRSLDFVFETHDKPLYQDARRRQLPERARVHANHRVQVPHGAGPPEDDDRQGVPARGRRPVLPGTAARERGALSSIQGARRRDAGRELRRKACNVQVLQHGPGRRAGARARRRHDGRATQGGVKCVPWLSAKGLELWAGAECSVARLGDRYVDQLERTGHARRLEDLDRLASLGVRALRQPVLWERTAPRGPQRADCGWADERLARLRSLGVRPIVGLVHHGSGPPYTSLLEESFVSGLAQYARLVAERYPWVLDFTPVNEPLTTARFSALYGHWYPHARSAREFVHALAVECRATRAAMRAIREVVPGARLVQTEDIGTTFATPRVAYQARFENERRFLSLDLLAGRVTRAHPLWHWLVVCGELDEGVLDDLRRQSLHPGHRRGQLLPHERPVPRRATRALSGRLARRQRARCVRGRRGGPRAFARDPRTRAILELVGRRYGRPVALTEAHAGGPPEQQVRWLSQAWKGALEARESGVDVRAVTAWSAFGSYDWDSLLVDERGHYEAGLFDVRCDEPRPTALARVVHDLARRGESNHPLLAGQGWWERPSRLLYPPAGPAARPHAARRCAPLLVVGAKGTLGTAVVRACSDRGIEVVALRRDELDVADADAVGRALDELRPWALVNAVGYVRVDDAERHRALCVRANVTGARVLAEACAARVVRFATFSSDLVFDGAKGAPYVEDDPVRPLNAYGGSKAVAEQLVLDRCPDAIVARTSAFFGPWDRANFVRWALVELLAGRHVRAASDVVVSPTYVPDLAHATLTLLIDGARGVFHVANPGAITWYELARSAARMAEAPTGRLVPCRGADLGWLARRPVYSALASSRCGLLRPLDDALSAFCREWTMEGIVFGRQSVNV